MLPDQVHAADIWSAHEVAHWHTLLGTDEDRPGMSSTPLSIVGPKAVDSISARDDQFAAVPRARRSPQAAQKSRAGEIPPGVDHLGDEARTPAEDVGVDAGSDELQTRGAANFSAWLKTRRQLDGEGATFVVEVRGDDGNLVRVDLMRVAFSDLPASIQAKFEYRKFPDLTAFTLVRETDNKVQSGSVEGLESNTLTSHSDHDVRSQWRHTSSVSNPSGSADSAAAKDAEAAGAVPPDRYERARSWPVQTAPAFGISLGGLLGGARQAMQGVGRAKGGAGRSAASTLATLGETIGATSGRQREQIAQRVRRWREARASEALESLAKTQAQFETALRIVRGNPDLRSYFRSWDARSTALSRRRTMQRFREAIMARRIGEATVEQIDNLFQQAEVVRVNAVRAVRRLDRAAHGAEAVQRSLAAWFRRTSKQAGPLTSVAGESLAERLAQMADAIGKVFEQLADRIARLTSARPT